ncbi:MAG: diacylglycerol/lipid kinase family protein [Alistipes finegoldii]
MGCVNGLWFVNIFSFGIFTTTSQRTPDKRKHRDRHKLAYIIEGVKEFRSMHAVPLEIEADGERFDLRSLMVLIFNGETAGGFHPGAPFVDQRRPFGLHPAGEEEFFRSTLAMCRYLAGGQPKIVRHLQARTIDIRSTVNEPTDVDGQKGAEFPLHIECIAGGLRIIVRKTAIRNRCGRRWSGEGLVKYFSDSFWGGVAISDRFCYFCRKNYDDMADNGKATRGSGRENLRKVSISRLKRR